MLVCSKMREREREWNGNLGPDLRTMACMSKDRLNYVYAKVLRSGPKFPFHSLEREREREREGEWNGNLGPNLRTMACMNKDRLNY